MHRSVLLRSIVHHASTVNDKNLRFGRVVDVKPFSHRSSAAPDDNLRCTARVRLEESQYETTNGVRSNFVQVVSRAIHVGEYEVDGLEAPLFRIRPGARPRQLAEQAINHHRLMERPVPEPALFKYR